MRFLIVLCCLATAYAASLGYNYDRSSGETATDGDQTYQPSPVEQSHAGNDYNAPTEYVKEFYSYSAPEADFDAKSAHPQLANSSKRNLRVIFIKGPENSGLENAALQLAKSAVDQQTAIYVFNKKTDIGDLTNKLHSLNKNVNSKPEVHFVKYRTPADAENAQRAIQSQYDALGGKSSSHNGGVAPVLDFASKTPSSSQYQAADPANSYLPANKRV